MAREFIDNAALRAAAERRMAQGYPLCAIAEDGGWLDEKGKPDTTSVRRRLGMTPESSGRPCSCRIEVATATRLARAIDVDPVDVGL